MLDAQTWGPEFRFPRPHLKGMRSSTPLWPQPWGGTDRQVPGDYQPATLAKLMSSRFRESLSQKEKMKRDGERWPMSTSSLHESKCELHICTQTCIYNTYTHHTLRQTDRDSWKTLCLVHISCHCPDLDIDLNHSLNLMASSPTLGSKWKMSSHPMEKLGQRQSLTYYKQFLWFTDLTCSCLKLQVASTQI